MSVPASSRLVIDGEIEFLVARIIWKLGQRPAKIVAIVSFFAPYLGTEWQAPRALTEPKLMGTAQRLAAFLAIQTYVGGSTKVSSTPLLRDSERNLLRTLDHPSRIISDGRTTVVSENEYLCIFRILVVPPHGLEPRTY